MSQAFIQLAIDCISAEKSLAIVEACKDYVDIIEIGTPCLKVNGASLLEQILAIVGAKPVLVDTKTMDAGFYEVDPFYTLGASICTVLGAAGETTIQGVVSAAQKHGKQSQVDLINCTNKQAIAELACQTGASIIGIHTGIDAQQHGETPFADLQRISSLKLKTMISVAGGINKHTAPRAIELGADIVVVGGAITGADNPRQAARDLYQAIR
ncbi:MAG: 3-hexulose-6-phosphate synthase [Vulcanococcus sp.]